MVGVPGKYKGCETCRQRRVKCSNERPHCQKCIKSGRECEGYEREMVFITGTPENRGRVASHPRKTPSLSSSSSARGRRLKAETGSTPELTTPERTPEPQGARSFQGLAAAPPLASAWEDYIILRRSQGTDCYALLTALQAPLRGVSSSGAHSVDGDVPFMISLAPYTPTELPMMTGGDMFNASARCLVHLSSADGGEGPARSYCVFLSEHTLETPADLGFSQPVIGPVQRMGPQHYTCFPNHHFFVRVYRPMTISAALLKRRATFLSDADWTTTPWVMHPKCPLDQLLDLIAYLPTLLERSDQIAELQPTLSRRHEAQQILQGCLALEARFERWLQLANQGTPEQPLSYWTEATPTGSHPFAHTYAFRDNVTGIMFLYYWMSQIPLRRCIDALYGIIFLPVVDSYPDMWPELPAALHLDDPTRYTQTQMRELAANMCRGLDAALAATTQPDMLVAPMTIAHDLYSDVNATIQEGFPEILWLEAFRARLVEKGQHLASVLQANSWFEIARY